MPKINKAPVWYPPQFPIEGRLPQSAAQVERNLRKRSELERDYQDALSVAAGARRPAPCCKTLYVSLFFDGTGNNLNNDLYESKVPHPTNIARLFRACIGAGHAGGTGHRANAGALTDAVGTGHGQYFKYYMPGVGTPFPEVGDLDYSGAGLALASWGEERINWALMMLIDALRRALGLPRRDDTYLQEAVTAMGSWHGAEWITGRTNRRNVFSRELKALQGPLRIALNPAPGQSKWLGVHLYVFGFSRGAAAARAFVNWLNQLLAYRDGAPALETEGARLPLSVEYLGLLDTVVSVGLADVAPVASGHMGWGDGTQELPKGPLIKRCLHIVSSHEQRLSFPLDSIRREDGTYPDNSVEVIHPGMHSDQGGGYPAGDQGKGFAEDVRIGDGLLLSQIALHDLYADAYLHGTPLKVSQRALSTGVRNDHWRALEADLEKSFAVSSELVRPFNAWRVTTLGFTENSTTSISNSCYQPNVGGVSLEDAIRNQMDWLTAWRIDRYAFGSLKDQNFYKVATDGHSTQQARQQAEAERNARQAEVEKRRELQQFMERRGKTRQALEPGVKDFDPDIAQTQLREAAEEFGRNYRDPNSDPWLKHIKKLIDLLRLNPNSLTRAELHMLARSKLRVKLAEHERTKKGGQAKVSLLFPPPPGLENHTSENHRGRVDETLNSDQPLGLLRALFDDQVHDSRAWFLHSMLNNSYQDVLLSLGREPWGSYFTERMVFFGDADRRDVALLTVPEVQSDSSVALVVTDGDKAGRVQTPEERRAKIQKEIDAILAAVYGEVQGGRNA